MRPNPQPIRLIDQQIDPLPPLQHPLNVLRHDPLHIIDILLHIRNRILLARLRRPIRNHQLLELRVEVRSAVGWQVGEIGVLRIVAREELLFDFDEVAEGDAPAEGGGGDDEVGKAAGGGVARGMVRRGVGDVVDEVLVVRVGEFLGFVVIDFGEDEGGEGGGLGGGGGGVFGEDGGSVGDA